MSQLEKSRAWHRLYPRASSAIDKSERLIQQWHKGNDSPMRKTLLALSVQWARDGMYEGHIGSEDSMGDILQSTRSHLRMMETDPQGRMEYQSLYEVTRRFLRREFLTLLLDELAEHRCVSEEGIPWEEHDKIRLWADGFFDEYRVGESFDDFCKLSLNQCFEAFDAAGGVVLGDWSDARPQTIARHQARRYAGLGLYAQAVFSSFFVRVVNPAIEFKIVNRLRSFGHKYGFAKAASLLSAGPIEMRPELHSYLSAQFIEPTEEKVPASEAYIANENQILEDVLAHCGFDIWADVMLVSGRAHGRIGAAVTHALTLMAVRDGEVTLDTQKEPLMPGDSVRLVNIVMRLNDCGELFDYSTWLRRYTRQIIDDTIIAHMLRSLAVVQSRPLQSYLIKKHRKGVSYSCDIFLDEEGKLTAKAASMLNARKISTEALMSSIALVNTSRFLRYYSPWLIKDVTSVVSPLERLQQELQACASLHRAVNPLDDSKSLFPEELAVRFEEDIALLFQGEVKSRHGGELADSEYAALQLNGELIGGELDYTNSHTVRGLVVSISEVLTSSTQYVPEKVSIGGCVIRRVVERSNSPILLRHDFVMPQQSVCDYLRTISWPSTKLDLDAFFFSVPRMGTGWSYVVERTKVALKQVIKRIEPWRSGRKYSLDRVIAELTVRGDDHYRCAQRVCGPMVWQYLKRWGVNQAPLSDYVAKAAAKGGKGMARMERQLAEYVNQKLVWDGTSPKPRHVADLGAKTGDGGGIKGRIKKPRAKAVSGFADRKFLIGEQKY
jgi:hypothetical protein